MTFWRVLGGGRRGEKPAFLENGFQGGEEHVGRGCERVAAVGTPLPPLHVLPGLGFVCGAPGGGASAAPWPERIASGGGLGAVVAGGAGVGGEARVLSRDRPAGLGGARLPRACAWRRNALPARAVGLGAAATAPRGAGGWGSRAHGSARGGEPCVTAETAALGGGESPWPGAAAASLLRGEIVRLQCSGGSDRDCGLMLGGGHDGLGLVLGGFPLKEVVGHLKAQSTCF